MLQIANKTPFAPLLTVLPDVDGVDTLHVLVKGTFTISPKLEIAPKQVPPIKKDEYFGDPASSSLKLSSETQLDKPSTDIVLVGNAWSPSGKPVPEMLAAVSVGPRRKVIRVVGDRQWKGRAASKPVPFVSMPLVYERAFGGVQKLKDGRVVAAEDYNPVGVGFVGKSAPADVADQKLPNLEDPRRPLEKFGDRLTPCCFGFVAASWLPRRTFAGTYDDAWAQNRAPYLPKDFDRRFFNVASAELVCDRFLAGGEPVEVNGASRQGLLRFALPRQQLQATIRMAGSSHAPPMRLETVLIEPDENRVCLTWRGVLACDKKALKIEWVLIEAKGVL